MFFYILVLGDLDSNFLYYGQPFWGGVGGLNLCICDGGQLLSAKWLTGIIFFPKQVILVNKIVD